MDCWICGSDADSAEHRLKASDARMVFGEISPAAPIYSIDKQERPVRIQSVKSRHLAFEQRICRKCNNERTQPHDRAWEALSRHFFDTHQSGKLIGSVNFKKY